MTSDAAYACANVKTRARTGPLALTPHRPVLPAPGQHQLPHQQERRSDGQVDA